VLIVVVGVEVKGHRVKEPAGASVNNMNVFNTPGASRPVESDERCLERRSAADLNIRLARI
jgi:hypothetical protein